ncbi:hypothetical protein RHS04_07633 [Rhizoctonia solani]|uniref:Uncharacterized protein n=1 Tax=Rhizoctonia solani TaxID=456999 RepID=A0A8H7H358_9AGAM|nr:hypothetical protein RHS04_07633 [Rhizoctonia solani]
MFFSAPVSTFLYSGVAGSISAGCNSLSVRPRPNDRFRIPRPLSWNTRHECLGEEWYNEHKGKTFSTLQYRKQNEAPWHEFILLFLDDRSVCRVERTGMADENNRHGALFSHEIPAVDFMQVLPASVASDYEAGPVKSMLVTEIRYLEEIKLLSVLDICYAMQLDSDAKKYTLWRFNCYFFAWSIILILSRQIAQWDLAFMGSKWDDACNDAAKALGLASQKSFNNLAFGLEDLLTATGDKRICEIVAQHIRGQSPLLNRRAKALLWTKQAPDIIRRRLENSIRHSITENTFHILFPEFGRFSLQSPITPIEPKPWDRDQPSTAHYPTSAPISTKSHEHMVPKTDTLPVTPARSHPFPTLSEFFHAPMYQTSSLVLSAVYEGVRIISQPESQNAVGIPAMDLSDWRSQLDRLLTETSLTDPSYLRDLTTTQ